MFDLPSHVRPSEWITVLVLVAASGGAALRVSSVYSRELFGGVVALLLAVNAVLVWAAFRNNSLRRQRALGLEFASEYRE